MMTNLRALCLFGLLSSLSVTVYAETELIVAPGQLTLTQALGQAVPGTIIKVSPGSYTAQTGEKFPLIVPTGVTIIGDETTKGRAIIITGGGKFLSPTVAGQDVAMVAGKDTKVMGLTVSDPNKRGYSLWIEGSNAIIANNTLTGSNNDGMMITGASTAQINGNYFYKNNSDGLTVLSTATPIVQNNLFEETGFGINVDGKSAPQFINNIIRKCVDGVVVFGQAQPIFRGNRFEKNRRSGIAVGGQAKPDLGTATDPGKNVFVGNGLAQINNTPRSTEILLSYGNQYDRRLFLGRVKVEGTLVNVTPITKKPPAKKTKVKSKPIKH